MSIKNMQSSIKKMLEDVVRDENLIDCSPPRTYGNAGVGFVHNGVSFHAGVRDTDGIPSLLCVYKNAQGNMAAISFGFKDAEVLKEFFEAIALLKLTLALPEGDDDRTGTLPEGDVLMYEFFGKEPDDKPN